MYAPGEEGELSAIGVSRRYLRQSLSFLLGDLNGIGLQLGCLSAGIHWMTLSKRINQRNDNTNTENVTGLCRYFGSEIQDSVECVPDAVVNAEARLLKSSLWGKRISCDFLALKYVPVSMVDLRALRPRIIKG